MSDKLREGLRLVVEGFGDIENQVEAKFAGRKMPADELEEAQGAAKVTELRDVLEAVIEEHDLSLEQFALFTSAIYEAIEEVDPEAFVEEGEEEEYEYEEYDEDDDGDDEEDDDEEYDDEEEYEEGEEYE